MDKPHPKARKENAPSGRDPRWQPGTCQVRLADGSIVSAWTHEKDVGGAPRPRFFASGSWWSLPFSEAF